MSGPQRQMIEHGHIVRFSLRNADKTGNVAAQIQQRVQVAPVLLFAKFQARDEFINGVPNWEPQELAK